MKYEFSEQVINNLVVFLDRIEFKGIKEHTALGEILEILRNPIKEQKSDNQEICSEQK